MNINYVFYLSTIKHKKKRNMANRKRSIDEKVNGMTLVFKNINIAQMARKTGIPESTLRYDLSKICSVLPVLLQNEKPGPTKNSEKKIR
jgi:hypothetical protein